MSPRPAEACPSDERLAAYIDGGLSEEERRRVIAHLDGCERCMELYAAASELRDEMAPAAGQVRRLGRGPLAAIAAALAAALVLAVLLGSPGGFGSGDRGPEVVVAGLVRDGVAPAGYDGDGWPRYRGPGPAAGTGAGRSFRAGVRAVDLDLALAAGDGESARTALTDLIGVARDFGLPAAPAAAVYRELADDLAAGRPFDEMRRLAASAAETLAGAAEPGPFKAGRWAESGRLAAAAGRADLLGRRAFRRWTTELDRTALPPELAAAVDSIVPRLSPPAADLEAAFAAAVRLGGGAPG